MTNLDSPLHADMAGQAAAMAERITSFSDRFEATLREISFRPNYHLDSGYLQGKWWIEIVHERHDSVTGTWGQGRGGKRWFEPTATMSDVIRTVFGAYLAYEEHEVREFFRYRGQRVFSPHMDIQALATWLRETGEH